MTDLDPKKFDLIAAIEGRSYPEERIPVILDEAGMYAYAKARQDADYDPANKEKEALATELLKAFEGSTIYLTVRGVPRYMEENVVAEVEKEFPPKFTAFGGIEPNRAANERYNLLRWLMHVRLMEYPDGTQEVPTANHIEAMRRGLPGSGLEAISAAIERLSTFSKSGYEQIVQDPDFLSQH